MRSGEAGLRTRDQYSPYPEEIHRRLTPHEAIVLLSDFVMMNRARLEGIDINPIRMIRGEAVVLDATIILR